MAFQHYVTTRFFEIDRAGIVFFARLFEYCHTAFEALLAQVYGNLEEAFARGALAMPVVHSQADFLQPMRWGETLRIDLTVERCGERSITLAYSLSRSTDATLVARARITHALQSMAGEPAPARIFLAAIQEHLATDPADPAATPTGCQGSDPFL